MDTLDNPVYNDPLNPINGGQLPADVESQMKSTTPWMRFIGIVGVILLFLMLAISVMGMINDPEPRTMGMFIAYLIGGIIMFFPLLFLMQSAKYFKGYVVKRDHNFLLRAFMKQKAYWRYMGIFMVIYLALVVIGLVFMIVAASSSMMGY